MSQTMYVKPAPGVKVRRPERNHEHLPEAGAEVPRNAYWMRRLRDGDVQEVQVPRAQGSAGAADVQEVQVPPKKTSKAKE